MTELGYATTTVFDAAGRPTTIVDADARTKTLIYDGASNKTGMKYSDGTLVTLQYDLTNRLTTATDWAGATTFAYSERSELVGKTDPGALSQAYRYDPVSNRIGLTDTDGKSVTATFDPLNRSASLQKQTGRIYTPTYDQDSRRATLTLGTGMVRHYGYDPVGQLTTQVDYSGTTPISTMIDGYDPVGNRITRLLDNVPYTWTYDNQYRLKMQQTAMGNASFVYDSVDNMLVKWNGGPAPLTMSFDPATRLTTSIQGTTVGTYTFDNAGNQILDNVAGALATCQYDPENRLLFASSSSGVSSYPYQGYNGLRRSWAEPTFSLTTTVWDGSDYLQERS